MKAAILDRFSLQISVAETLPWPFFWRRPTVARVRIAAYFAHFFSRFARSGRCSKNPKNDIFLTYFSGFSETSGDLCALITDRLGGCSAQTDAPNADSSPSWSDIGSMLQLDIASTDKRQKRHFLHIFRTLHPATSIRRARRQTTLQRSGSPKGHPRHPFCALEGCWTLLGGYAPPHGRGRPSRPFELGEPRDLRRREQPQRYQGPWVRRADHSLLPKCVCAPQNEL